MSSRKWEDPSIFQLRLHQIKQELVQRGLSTTGSNKDVISRFRSVLNCEHEDTRRTLNEAVRNQNAETVKRVLSSCIVDAPRSDNNAGLRGHGGTVAVRQLLFVDDYHKADFLNEALHLAVKRGFHDLARELLLEGGDPNLPYSGTPHIVAAAMQGSEKMVEVLIEAGVQLDQEDHSGMCAVYMAVKRGNHDALTVLLTGGADRDACHGDTGRTALMHACSVGNVCVFGGLLWSVGSNVRSGPKCNTVTSYLTPSYIALPCEPRMYTTQGTRVGAASRDSTPRNSRRQPRGSGGEVRVDPDDLCCAQGAS